MTATPLGKLVVLLIELATREDQLRAAIDEWAKDSPATTADRDEIIEKYYKINRAAAGAIRVIERVEGMDVVRAVEPEIRAATEITNSLQVRTALLWALMFHDVRDMVLNARILSNLEVQSADYICQKIADYAERKLGCEHPTTKIEVLTATMRELVGNREK